MATHAGAPQVWWTGSPVLARAVAVHLRTAAGRHEKKKVPKKKGEWKHGRKHRLIEPTGGAVPSRADGQLSLVSGVMEGGPATPRVPVGARRPHVLMASGRFPARRGLDATREAWNRVVYAPLV